MGDSKSRAGFMGFWREIRDWLFPPDVERLTRERDVDGLIRVLMDPPTDTLHVYLYETQAIEALGTLQDPRARDALLHVLGHPDGRVRAASARALSGIADVRVALELGRALDDADERVRASAAEVLHSNNFAPILPACSQARLWIQRGKWTKCVRLGEPAIPMLIQELERSTTATDERKLEKLLHALAQLGSKRAISPIVGIYRSELAIDACLQALITLDPDNEEWRTAVRARVAARQRDEDDRQRAQARARESRCSSCGGPYASDVSGKCIQCDGAS